MTEIEWADPPQPRHLGRHGWRLPIVAELKERPGVWARVQTGLKYTSLRSAWARLGCEVTMRTVTADDGTKAYDVYARWPETTS